LPVVSETPASSGSATDHLLRVGFLGPEATFCEQAVRSQPDLAAGELVPYPSMPEVLYATAEGAVDVGVVAIEYALEGMVNVTVDTMAFDVDVYIQREIVVPVRLELLGVPGATLDGIEAVASMPVAFGQTRRFLHESLPRAIERSVDSTAGAAELVAKTGDPSVAALANALAGERYGLETLVSGVEDHADNATRFVAVAPGRIPAPTGHDKTTIVVFQHADRPGSLLAILQEFAARAINLTRLESRPARSGLGHYCFLIDLEGHIADEVVADALRVIRAEQATCKFLGSYPAAGSDGAAVRADVSESVRAAQRWMDDLRTHIVAD
jgi:prephenate dehydratase